MSSIARKLIGVNKAAAAASVTPYIFVTSQNTDQVISIDVSTMFQSHDITPASSVSNSTTLDGAIGGFVDTVNDYLWVACRLSDSITVIDISDPTNMSILGSFNSSSNMNSCYNCHYDSSSDILITVGQANDIIAFWDVSSWKTSFSGSPTLLDTYTNTNSLNNFSKIAVDTSRQMVFSGSQAFVSIDYSDLVTNGSSGSLTVFSASTAGGYVSGTAQNASLNSGGLQKSDVVYWPRKKIVFRSGDLAAGAEVWDVSDSNVSNHTRIGDYINQGGSAVGLTYYNSTDTGGRYTGFYAVDDTSEVLHYVKNIGQSATTDVSFLDLSDLGSTYTAGQVLMPVLTEGEGITTARFGLSATNANVRGSDVLSTIDENGNRVILFSTWSVETICLINLGSASSVSQSTYTDFDITHTSGNASASTGWYYQLDHAGLTMANTNLIGGINSDGTAMSNVY